MSLLSFKSKDAPDAKVYKAFDDIGAGREVRAEVYQKPFKHLSIDELLAPEHYQALTMLFKNLLAKGIKGKGNSQEEFTRYELYDLYSFMPKPTLELPLAFFYAESYFKMIEYFFDTTLSRDTFLTFHHHKPNKEDNYIHNDLVMGNFVDDPLPNGVNAWFSQCNHTKESSEPGVRKMVRAIAVIYYLNNYEWDEKLSGETGIFETRDTSSLVRKMPPINNHLTAFQISPISFHNFMKNNSPSRNSIAQWFFIDEAEAQRRFPGYSFGTW